MTIATLTAILMAVFMAQPAGERPCGSQSTSAKGGYHEQATCEGWSQTLAKASTVASIATGTIDPLTIAALSGVESRWDPMVRHKNPQKAWGLWGLNPRYPWYRRAVAHCQVAPHTCAVSQAIEAASLLASEKRRCGSLTRAVMAYGSGTCDGAPDYLRQFMAHRTALARVWIRVAKRPELRGGPKLSPIKKWEAATWL